MAEVIDGMRSPSARPEPRSGVAAGHAKPGVRRFGSVARNLILVVQNRRNLLPNGGVEVVPHTVRFIDGKLETDDADVIKKIESLPTYGDGIGGEVFDLDRLRESTREAELSAMEKRLLDDPELRGRFLKRSGLQEFILDSATLPEQGEPAKKK